MNTKILTSIFICLTILVYGQNIRLQHNINYEARQLKQNLNPLGDSLLLESIHTIRQVDIFNKEYSETFHVESTETQIDLKTLPIGNFIIKVIMGRKHIVMYLEKYDDKKLKALDRNVRNNSLITASEDLNFKTNNALLVEAVANNRSLNKSSFYWVVYECNSNFGSSKTMKLEDKRTVAKLITKNKLERKSKIGKHNRLYVYEVYHVSEFMDKQSKNPQFYMSSSDSNLFNVMPFYDTTNQIQTVATLP
ncbi:MAG: hypothetical protein GYB35_04925 [Algicola sp.]|nr:hypothetical protein [Algicola sp.]